MRREDFPQLREDIVYLDNGATTQKPQCVIDAEMEYYQSYCANIHRSSHSLSNRATQSYEEARESVAKFLKADPREIIFTRGTTESINLVASSYVRDNFKKVIITPLEHHSNIVPWHLQGFTDDKLIVLEINHDLRIDLEKYEETLESNPNSFISLIHVSNTFGILNPVDEMIEIAHKYGCKVLIDGAQSVAHFSIDIKALDADFFAFSGHKIYGPTGIGVLYGKYELLDEMRAYHGGGAMIESVEYGESTYLKPPLKFEAGTVNIAGAIGLGRAIEYINELGFKRIIKEEQKLRKYFEKMLKTQEDVIVYTKSDEPIFSFNVDRIHHSDVGILLDKQKVSIRVGHHCTMPILNSLGITGTIRVSLCFYNTKEDINKFFARLTRAVEMLKS